MFATHAVTKRFGPTPALAEFSHRFAAGRTTVLIGPSGCGKSTLLRLLIGLIEPDAGEIRFDGRVVTPAGRLALRRRVGFMVQGGGLFPHLTARQNVQLLARHLGRPPAAVERRTTELADLVRLPADALDRHPTRLSGGQQQRVALMRALFLEPAVLLLDEPLGALDPLVRRALQDDLKTIFARLRQTVILVTHDLPEAAFFGHEILLLAGGRIVQAAAPAELLRHPHPGFATEFVQAHRTLATPAAPEEAS